MKLHYYYYKMPYLAFTRNQEGLSFESRDIVRRLFGRYGKKLIWFPRVQKRSFGEYGFEFFTYEKIADYSSKRKFQEQDFWY